MELKGIYIIDNNSDVHLIEIQFDDTPGNIDVGQITQELEGQPRGNWQRLYLRTRPARQGMGAAGGYIKIKILFKYCKTKTDDFHVSYLLQLTVSLFQNYRLFYCFLISQIQTLKSNLAHKRIHILHEYNITNFPSVVLFRR